MSDKFFVVHHNYLFQPEPKRTVAIDNMIAEIKDLNPAAIITFCGYEVDIQTIYKDFIDKIKPWLESNNKKFIIFSPAIPVNFDKEYFSVVNWFEYRGYDIMNFNYIINYYDMNKPILTNPSKLFTCYNNRPDKYRTYTIDQLAKFNLLYEGIVTYRHFTEVLPKQDPNFNLSDEFMYYTGTPRLADEDDFVLHQGYTPNDLPNRYLDGLIDIVTESRIEPGEFFVSEKINKPLLAQKPFLVVSCQHYHKWLKEHYGIEPYTELFDYRFDEFERMEHRVIGIVKNICRLIKEYKTPEDYVNLLKTLKPKLEHNLNIYLKETARGDKLLKNIPALLKVDQTTLLSEYLVRGEKDYEFEFCNLHSFIHGVVKPYHKGIFHLPDISR